MANVPQTSALIVLAQEYAGNIVAQINRMASTLRFIPIVVGEGQNCAWVAEGDSEAAEFYLEGADAANFGSDSQDSAILPWVSMRKNFSVTGMARAKAGATKTPQANIALWAKNVVNASANLASELNKSLFTGESGQTPGETVGFYEAIGDTTNTYAGIDRMADAFWRPYVVDPGTPTAITLDLIRKDLSSIYVNSGVRPDLAVVHPDTFAAISKLFDSGRQYVQSVVNTARGKITLDGGVDSISFGGCTFVEDKDCVFDGYSSSGSIAYLNTNYVEYQVLPQNDSPMLEAGTMLTMNDGFGALPLMMSYEQLAKTGDAIKAMCKIYGQLVVKKPNTCGTRFNVLIP